MARARRDRTEAALGRRTLLEWLGGGTLFALARCAGAPPSWTGPDAGREAADGGPEAADGGRESPDGGPDLADGGADAGAEGPDAGAGDAGTGSDGGIDFAPGSGAQGPGVWPERTADRQSAESLLATWTLRVDGLVASPLELTFAQLLRLERTDLVMDFHCVEGWSVRDVPWNGVHLSRLAERAGPLPEATHLTLHSVGGKYVESLPLPVALEPHSLLAYGVGGAALPLVHGFPLRMVVPRLFGYKNAKYVTGLELADHPVNGFWVSRGHPYDGEVPEWRLRKGRY